MMITMKKRIPLAGMNDPARRPEEGSGSRVRPSRANASFATTALNTNVEYLIR
jgi:hypothetical protein